MSWIIENGVHRATVLLDLGWIEHGFGSACSPEWNLQDNLTSLSQIHSDACVVALAGPGRIGRGDAILTAVAGLRIGVRTADCVPVLLADPVHKAVAAVHAGWRGTVQEIVKKAVGSMGEMWNSRAGDLVAAIGPSAGGCCYQVGREVAEQFIPWFPERNDLNPETLLDLREANRRQLLDTGIPPASIAVSGACTICGGDEFYSWRRRPHEAGRMVNSILIR